jgi:hypothetical protein
MVCMCGESRTYACNRTAIPFEDRLRLAEWSVLAQREELDRTKALFLREITDLQAALLAKTAELDDAEAANSRLSVGSPSLSE